MSRVWMSVTVGRGGHDGDDATKENSGVRLKNDQVPPPYSSYSSFSSSSSFVESGDSDGGKKRNGDVRGRHAEESLQKAMFVSCWSLN